MVTVQHSRADTNSNLGIVFTMFYLCLKDGCLLHSDEYPEQNLMICSQISHLPFVRISRCATMVRCTWRKIVNAWFFSSYKHNLSPCPRNLSFPAKSLRIKVLLMEAHCILWPVNPMAWRVHIYLDQMRLYWYNKIVFMELSAIQSEVWLIKLEITIFS